MSLDRLVGQSFRTVTKSVVFLALLGPAAVLLFPFSASAIPSEAMFAFSPSGLQTLTLTTLISVSPFVTGTVTVSASSTGWWDQTGAHSADVTNYIAGICGTSDFCGDDLNRHNFFVFNNLPTQLILSAILSIGNAPGGYFSSKPSLTYRVWDVATSVDALTATNTGQIGIFDDLGSGVEFGERIVSSADNGIQVLIPLSGNAIVGPLGLNNPTHLIAFGGSIDVSPVSPVPEPTTLLLLGTTGGLGFLARWRLRLRKKGIGRAEME